MERELICIVCPKGCVLKVKTGAADSTMETAGRQERLVTERDVSGNKCARGLNYAVNECNFPVRTLTTTIRLEGCNNRDGCGLVPARSSRPLPKSLLMDCMKVIRSAVAKPPLKVGDIIIENISGTGIDMVSTANITMEGKYE